MALDCGPDSVVRMPGAMAREESREVAKVRVTKGLLPFSCLFLGWGRDWRGGRYGSRKKRSEVGKCSVSLDILLRFQFWICGGGG